MRYTGAKPYSDFYPTVALNAPRSRFRGEVADSLAALVGILGHDASVLHDGRDALRVAPAAPPDVVLLDIGMPGMDGFEVARRLRSFPELASTRIVACTGYGREDDIRKIREAGFERHFTKPVGAAQLETLLAE